jgi:hypothetical protein
LQTRLAAFGPWGGDVNDEVCVLASIDSYTFTNVEVGWLPG